MTAARGNVAPRNVRLDTGEPVTLAAVLATAGEGTVYSVAGRPDLAAKVFHPTLKNLHAKLEKVAAMVQSPPPGRVQPNGFVVLTWPSGTVLDGGQSIGFVMPRIDTSTAVEIHTMSNPSNREDPLPTAPQWTRHATWGHLVNTAANLCLAVQVVHRVDAVIGDFQERNILVSDTTQVTLVDCDSMQFTDARGRQFLCGVGRPEFTAPELSGVDLGARPRGKPSDLFALAVHIHQLLMGGNHPFMRGSWTGSGQQPDALTLARSGSWAGGPASPLQTHPLAPPLTFLPGDIQQLFVRAFTGGVRDPASRPSAQEWRENLLRIELATCARGLHQIPGTTFRCPWCAIDAERQSRRASHARQRPGHIGPETPLTTSGSDPRPRRATELNPVAKKSNPQRGGLGFSPNLVVAGLAAVVVIVVILTVFIIWAVLSGASTFGAG